MQRNCKFEKGKEKEKESEETGRNLWGARARHDGSVCLAPSSRVAIRSFVPAKLRSFIAFVTSFLQRPESSSRNVLDMEQEMGGVAREAVKSLEKKGNKRQNGKPLRVAAPSSRLFFLPVFLAVSPLQERSEGERRPRVGGIRWSGRIHCSSVWV